MEIKKEYSNGELTIVWKPEVCIHSGICVRSLPEVYNPKDRPWIKQENATSDQLVEQIRKCPSGALSFYYNKDIEQNQQVAENTPMAIEISKNGPYILKGTFQLKDSQGKLLETKSVAALCRCGASANKPFCDGSHSRIGFEDTH